LLDRSSLERPLRLSQTWLPRAQATNTPMTLTQEITLLFVLLLTSKGAAGVTGSGFIVLARRSRPSATCRSPGSP
jgi:hypothetical protein